MFIVYFVKIFIFLLSQIQEYDTIALRLATYWMVINLMIYNAYIDESGDEGINRGSKWFILTAIIVEKSKDLPLARKIDETYKDTR